MSNPLRQISVKAIVVGFIVFTVVVMGANAARTHLYMKDQVRAYVTENMPSNLSGEERNKKASSLAMEFAAKPEQIAITITLLAISFLVAGYVAGSISATNINAAIVGIVGTLFTAGISIQSFTFWMTIIVGLVFATLGSWLAIKRKQRTKISHI